MNWVSPIKDEETLKKFKEALREVDDKYYILFEIGVGTGMQLQEILKFKNKDIRGKDKIEASIGTKNIKRTFTIPKDLKERRQGNGTEFHRRADHAQDLRMEILQEHKRYLLSAEPAQPCVAVHHLPLHR